MFKLYNYCCAAVFWKLRRRQIAEFPLGLARVDVPKLLPKGFLGVDLLSSTGWVMGLKVLIRICEIF